LSLNRRRTTFPQQKQKREQELFNISESDSNDSRILEVQKKKMMTKIKIYSKKKVGKEEEKEWQ